MVHFIRNELMSVESDMKRYRQRFLVYRAKLTAKVTDSFKNFPFFVRGPKAD